MTDTDTARLSKLITIIYNHLQPIYNLFTTIYNHLQSI